LSGETLLMDERITRRNISRFAAISTAGAGLLLGLRPVSAQSALPTVRMGTMPNDVEGEPFYGADSGTWQASGITADVTYFTTGANIITALLAGNIDVGIANPLSLAVAIARDIPLQALAPGVLITKQHTYPNLVIAKDSPMKSPKDLAGATIGVSEVKSFNYYSVLAWLDGYGVALKSIKFVELPFTEVGVALQRGIIQAGFLPEPFTSQFLAAGLIRLFGDTYIAIAPELSVAIWCGTRAWVKNNPDTVKKFLNGVYATAKYCNTHQAETGATLIRVAKLDPTTLSSVRRAYFATQPDKKYLDPILQMAGKYGALPRPVSYEEFMGAT
jgi:NitT/TauT family transport system substrate-binding protein